MNPTERKNFDSDLEYKNFKTNYGIFQAEKRLYRLWKV